MDNVKITPPGITTTVANQAQKAMGDRPTSTTNTPNMREGEKQLTLQWFGNKDVRVVEAPVPAITEPTDVICKVTGTTVCGSDLHLYHKEILQLQAGDILGHEWMGIVDEVGSDIKNVKKGDRVVASFQIACGTCSFCKEGLSSMCDTTNSSSVQEKLYGKPFAGLFGYSHFAGGFAGGQAEWVRCPFGDTNLLKIPDSVPDEKALYLSDIIPTSYHAVQCAEVTKGKSVAIWGAGPIGLYCAKWSKLAGARRVIVIDRVKERLDLAENKIGCDIINFDETKDVVDAIYKLEPEGVDCGIDAAAFRYTKGLLHGIQHAIGLETDSCEIPNEALRAVRKFGTISLVADYAAMTNQFLIGALMEKGITLRGTGQAPVQKYWKELLGKIESGEFDPTIILSHRFKIDEFRELYEAFDKKEMGIMKTFVQTKFSGPPAPGTPALSSLKDGDVKPSAVV
ncbi:putative zinc-type alcohol dehydrogenase-like protein [Mollisia scopiformis]|uniref:Putative zinc-type alcohol dehydrogenase-like protein n=1 Tax=Mollisia scopiformis TaxID=149040 RepID=A0A194X1R1_MOLSC|nr:putative zinc-type alcohol dehydrogenase-like protein [Mollisia scopiformis]KUJ13777.1 putative zinc-type alcohol dehydrogenase-like protein [Mollisia scopiformis]